MNADFGIPENFYHHDPFDNAYIQQLNLFGANAYDYVFQHQFRILTTGLKLFVSLVQGFNGFEKLFFGIPFRFFK